MAVVNYEFWVEIHKNYSDNVNTGAGAEYFYRSGPYNHGGEISAYTVTTPTRVNAEFKANGNISVVGTVSQSYDPTQGSLTLQFDTLDNTLISNLETNFLRTRVVIYRLANIPAPIFSDFTNAQYFDGNVTNFSIQGGQTNQIVQLDCESIFTRGNGVKGRTNAQLEPLSGITIKWGSIQWQS